MEFIRHKEHLTLEGLNEIVSYKAAMNLGLPQKKFWPPVNYGWRFTSAEGSFMIRI